MSARTWGVAPIYVFRGDDVAFPWIASFGVGTRAHRVRRFRTHAMAIGWALAAFELTKHEREAAS